MDTEVSFFTSDRLESFGYTKSKEKKEKFDRETNVEKTFFEDYRHLLEFHAQKVISIFFKRNEKRPGKEDFLVSQNRRYRVYYG